MKEPRSEKFKLIILAVVPFILFAPIYLSSKAIFWGTPATQFVPWREFAWEIFKDGDIPLWNPLLGMGAPLLANYQSAIFYIPNWIFFILDEIGGIGALAWVQAPLVAAHLAWAGLGMAYLAGKIGLSIRSQIISGLAFGLSGYLISRAGFQSLNSAVVWLPWIIGVSTVLVGKLNSRWLVEIPYQSISYKSWWGVIFRSIKSQIGLIVILIILVGMMFFAGHAQISWYTILLLLIWCSFLIVQFWGYKHPKNEEVNKRKGDLRNLAYKLLSIWVIIIIMLILAVGVSAIQLFPTAEYLIESQRSTQVDYEYGLTYSFWPWRFLTFIGPDFFGNPAQGDYWGYANYWEDAVYIGLLPLVLAIIAIVNGFRSNKKSHDGNTVSFHDTIIPNHKTLIRFLAVIIVISFVLALGKNTPIFPWLYRYVPTFDMFNGPTRFSVWAVFSMALLAGIGTEYWHCPEGRAKYWVRLGTAGAFAMMLGAGLAWIIMGDISPSFIRATATTGAGLMIIGGLTLTAPGHQESGDDQRKDGDHNRNTEKWSWFVLVFVAVDLLIAGSGLNPGIDLSFYRMEAPTTSEIREIIGDGRIFIPFDDESVVKFDRFFRFDTFNPGEEWSNLRAVQLPNLTMLDQLSSANNFDPLVPGRFATWLEIYRESEIEIQNRMLNLMSVEAVERVDIDERFGVRFEPRSSEDRFRWVPCGISTPDDQNSIELILSGTIDFRKEVIIEELRKLIDPVCDGTARGEVNLISENANEINLTVTSDTNGFVVISDVWYPGWKAEIDGHRLDVLKANYLFRAVSVPAGKHELRLFYQSGSFYLGAVISLLSILILVITYLINRNLQRTSLNVFDE